MTIMLLIGIMITMIMNIMCVYYYNGYDNTCNNDNRVRRAPCRRNPSPAP